MSQTPRHINTDRSLKRPERAADAPRHAASSTDAKQSTGGAHNEPPRRPAQGSGQGEPPRRRNKNKKKKTPLWLPFAVVMAIIAVISGVVVYGVSLVNKVEDSIRPDDSTPTIEEEVKTDEEYKGDVVNILVCGIDYEEGRNYSNDPTSNDGMTDMILYVQFDIKNGALRMLQIPRNSLVTTKNKKITLSNGKTYAATNYQINSVAISNGGSIAALADVIYDQFRLPIDYYVTVDMQALVDMVDNFGGIEVYIPHDMSYGGSKLLKGYRNLNGASAEFFVRCRHGDGYANSDIDRLNMQRYFYAGLFKRARAMGVTDILNQLPLVFKNYIKTDMDISTIAKLVVSFLKLDSSNIILAQTPVFMGVPNVGKTDTFAGYSCVVPDAGSIANLLNQYFCTYTGPIDVSEMNLVTDEWPHGSASTDANVQYMGRIDKESDDAILNGDTDLDGAVTTDGQAAGSAN
ncbi:MAG: LCP family protein [Faecalibacterium prausnitzii]|nr:LCP family protein [Faecalibacterium prausnitzii]